MLSRVWLFETPWSHQSPLSVGLSRQGYWSGLPFPTQGDLPDPGIKPCISWVSCIGRGLLYHCATWWAHLAHSEVQWSEFAQLCPTLGDPLDCSLPGFSDLGVFQARVLEWVPFPLWLDLRMICHLGENSCANWTQPLHLPMWWYSTGCYGLKPEREDTKHIWVQWSSPRKLMVF